MVKKMKKYKYHFEELKEPGDGIMITNDKALHDPKRKLYYVEGATLKRVFERMKVWEKAKGGEYEVTEYNEGRTIEVLKY